MIFYFNADGSRLGMYPESVVQGSVKANILYFVCPVPRTNVIHASFMLPDGQKTEKFMLKVESKQPCGVYDEFGNGFNVWSLTVPVAVTAQSGRVWVQFYSTANGETTATVRSGFTVEKGVASAEPEHGESYDGIINFLSGLTASMSEMSDNNKEVKKIADNVNETASSVNARIDILYSFFENTLVTKAVVEDKFSQRVTADGLDIIGETPSSVMKISGDTVFDETSGAFINANFKGIESYGKNMLDIDKGLRGEGFKINDDGNYMLSYVTASDRRSEIYPMHIKAGTRVYFSVNVLESMNVDDYCRFVFTDDSSYYLTGVSSNPGSNTFSLLLSKQVKYFEFYVHENEHIVFNSFMISLDSDSTYEKYNGDKSFAFTEAVSLGKWDYIDVSRGMLVKQTGVIYKDAEFTEEELAEHSEYILSADGKKLCYKESLQTETAIDVPESYIVHNKGVEIVDQGDENNSALGAECTVTQSYYVKAEV